MDYAVFVIPLALLVGKLRGGTLDNLASLPVRALWAAFLAFFLRIAANLPDVYASMGIAWINPYLGLINAFSFILLFYFCYVNFELFPIKIFTVGTLLNALAIFANGGRMPYEVEAAARAGTLTQIQALEKLGAPFVASQKSAMLWFFGDWIVLPGLRTYKLISPGDIILLLAIFLLIEEGMLKRSKIA